MKKLLIVGAAAGSGHTRAAEALEAWAKKLYNGKNIAVQRIEFSDYLARTTRAIFFATYEKFIYKIPELWRLVYDMTNHAEVSSIILKTAQLFQAIDPRHYIQAVKKIAPDYLLSTHFIPPFFTIPKLSDGRETKTGVVVTDYTPHALWMSGMSHDYFVPTPAIADALMTQGVPKNNISLSGIPVLPDYYNFKKGHTAETADTQVVIMAGGNALIPLNKIAQTILSIPGVMVTVITGKNKKLYETTKKMVPFYAGRLTVFSWVGKEFPGLINQADVVVSKPGGLTLTECLVMHKPFIGIHPIPGQEAGNAQIFTEYGGLLAHNDNELLEGIIKVQKKALAQIKPGLLPSVPAAKTILNKILHTIQNSEKTI